MRPPVRAAFLSSIIPSWRICNYIGSARSTSILLLPLLLSFSLSCCSSWSSSSVAQESRAFGRETSSAVLRSFPDNAIRSKSGGSEDKKGNSSGHSNTADNSSSSHRSESSEISKGSASDAASSLSAFGLLEGGVTTAHAFATETLVDTTPLSHMPSSLLSSSHSASFTSLPPSSAVLWPSPGASDSSVAISPALLYEGPRATSVRNCTSTAEPDGSAVELPSAFFSGSTSSSPSGLSSLRSDTAVGSRVAGGFAPAAATAGPSLAAAAGPSAAAAVLGPSSAAAVAAARAGPAPAAPGSAAAPAAGPSPAAVAGPLPAAAAGPLPAAATTAVRSPAAAVAGPSPAAAVAGLSPAAGIAGPLPGVDRTIWVVPGIAGSGLFAKITSAILPTCAAHAVTYAKFRVWAALSLMLPPLSHQKCWIEMMQQDVNDSGDVYTSKPGVDMQVDDYGGIHGVDFLDYYVRDSYGIPATAYMHGMLHTLMKLHYEPLKTLHAAPYDWRLPPWQFDFARLKKDIEDRYEANDQQKVELLAHSLGNIILCYFFKKVVDQAWKDKYIKTFTLVGAATGGSFKAVKCLLSGYNTATDLNIWSILNINFFPPLLLRDLLRTMGSMYALLPDPQVYGTDHIVALVARPPSSSLLSPRKTADAAERRGAAAEVGEQEWEKKNEDEGEETRDSVSDEHQYGEMRRRRLAAVDEKETDVFGVGDGAAHAAAEAGSAEEEKFRQQEEAIREAAEREYAARSSMSDEERGRLRNERLQAYAQEQQQRLKEALSRMEREDIPKDIYTLANWTLLLPPQVQQRAKAAREKLADIYSDPGVPVRCIWSTNDKPTTEIGYVYDTGSLDQRPIPILGFGDDTVPVESLSLCASWPSTFEKHELKNIDHMYIFGDKSFNQLIMSVYGPPLPQEAAIPVSSQSLAPAILVS